MIANVPNYHGDKSLKEKNIDSGDPACIDSCMSASTCHISMTGAV